MNKTEKLAILLATYQGKDYLKEQIDSLLSQTYQEWVLYIHDDGSQDGTLEIIENYIKQYPDKIVSLEGESLGGAKNNFFFLMAQVDAPYYMCCDQDDVWLPDKIEKSLNKLKEIETDTSIPSLVFTELKIVNNNLTVIAEKMSEYQRLDCENLTVGRMLMQNAVTGCTLIMNRALCQMALQCKNKENVIMHDWWISVIATQFGKVAYIKEPLILYRQHGKNAVGALDTKKMSYVIQKMKRFNDNKEAVRKTQIQAKELVDTFGLGEDSVAAKLASCLQVGKCKRIKIYRSNDLKKAGLARNIGLLIWG